MLSYKLAKELKEAGFPQKSYNAYKPNILQEVGTYDYYSPTLEELIDACGNHFRFLRHNVASKNWDAIYDKRTPTKKRKVIMNGKTPLEAVVKLFIELNK